MPSYQPPESTTNSEPAVKRRKRSLPCDTPEQTDSNPADKSDSDLSLFERVDHDHLPSAFLRKLPSHPVEHAITPAEEMPVNHSNETTPPSPAEHQESDLQTNDESQDNNARLKRKISRLEADLLDQRAFTEEAQKRVKQDMLLDIILQKEQVAKAAKNADLTKRRHDKEVAEWKVKVSEATDKVLKERDQRETAQATAEVYRVETEHLQNVNVIIQSDLDELRAVEVETAIVRKDESRGLPPAYGNLDDEHRFPPYSQHADGGSLEVAHLKREVRRRFEGRILEVFKMKTGKTPNMFVCMSSALEEACQSLGAVLDFAGNVPVSHAHSQSNRYIRQQTRNAATADQITAMTERLSTNALVGPSGGARVQQKNTVAKRKAKQNQQRAARSSNPSIALIQSPKGASYVADRIAKLLLDLLWRAVAACELRPKSGAFSVQMFGTTLATKYTGVDDVFVAALRLAFSKSCSIASFQFYLTQLETLAGDFKALGIAMTPTRGNGLSHFSYFAKTLTWLNDQVEKERELMANEGRASSAGSGYGTVDGEDDEDDSVSSRWEGSDAGSEGEDE